METMDTINLLKECEAGAKMAVSSIDEVLENISDSKLKQLLSESKLQHEALCDEIHTLLTRHSSLDKEPSAMAKGMSWIKTNLKLSMDDSDTSVADLITDGCNMGIKNLHKYQNEYSEADHTSKGLCKKLISLEESLCKDLKAYL